MDAVVCVACGIGQVGFATKNNGYIFRIYINALL
jgi:hypothetical protein